MIPASRYRLTNSEVEDQKAALAIASGGTPLTQAEVESRRKSCSWGKVPGSDSSMRDHRDLEIEAGFCGRPDLELRNIASSEVVMDLYFLSHENGQIRGSSGKTLITIFDGRLPSH